MCGIERGGWSLKMISRWPGVDVMCSMEEVMNLNLISASMRSGHTPSP